MDHETIKALIRKYNSQIDGLRGTVRLLELELGSNGSSPEITDPANLNGAQTKDGNVPVRQWEFASKSQTDAAEEVLTRIGHPLSIADLLDALERGGLKVGGETPLERRSNLATQLGRSGRFGKAARGTWGLPTWKNVEPVKRGSKNQKKETQKSKPASA